MEQERYRGSGGPGVQRFTGAEGSIRTSGGFQGDGCCNLRQNLCELRVQCRNRLLEHVLVSGDRGPAEVVDKPPPHQLERPPALVSRQLFGRGGSTPRAGTRCFFLLRFDRLRFPSTSHRFAIRNRRSVTWILELPKTRAFEGSRCLRTAEPSELLNSPPNPHLRAKALRRASRAPNPESRAHWTPRPPNPVYDWNIHA